MTLRPWLCSTVLAAALVAGGCKKAEAPQPAPSETSAARPVAPVLATADAVDVHSYAQPLIARVAHIDLDLDVDFASRRLAGTATIDIEARPDATEIVLDDKGLQIESIVNDKNEPLDYRVGEVDPALGAPLTITMGKARKIRIRYRSAENAGALQWLTPEQTAGKKHPYLFSQGQAIENRTWMPTQDSPGIRQTWTARIRVPQELTAVMSAPRVGEPVPDGNKRVFRFEMEHPVAPYLIAIAVGDLAFRPLGARTGVWTEPSMLDKASAELVDTERMVSAAEALFGPYRWGRYDMLVLPPSFPFGGMENPTMTFLTPTFIAGDRSLVSLIAHELAHSWSGNLATNATWADMWLNEGLTTYAERRIVEAVFGPKVAAQQVALGNDALQAAINDNGGMTGGDTRLHVDLKKRHPDEALTDIPYEKGAAFLRMLEQRFGRERFDGFLKGWFDRHAFQPVTSKMFLDELRQHLVKGDAATEQALQLDRWVYEPGIPDNATQSDPAAFAAVDAAIAGFANEGSVPTAAWGGWTTDERLRFLQGLPRKVETARLDKLAKELELTRTGNNEVLFAWLTLAVANRYDPAVPALEQFLATNGRRKFIRPLMTALANDKQWGRPIAVRVYAKARPIYHPLVTRELDEMGLAPEADAPAGR